MGGGKPFPQTVSDRKAYVVEFDGLNDSWNPKKWPSSTRYVVGTMILGFKAKGRAQAVDLNHCLLQHVSRNVQQRTLRSWFSTGKPRLLSK